MLGMHPSWHRKSQTGFKNLHYIFWCHPLALPEAPAPGALTEGTGALVPLPPAASPSGKVTVTQPGSMAGTSWSAVAVAESGPWLEKQMQDGLSLGVGEGAGSEDRLRAGVWREKGIFGRGGLISRLDPCGAGMSGR